MKPADIQILDKAFTHFISESEISEAISKLAKQLNGDYAGKNPILVPVLNGSFMFAADLVKKLEFDCEVSFIKVASYQGVDSTGEVEEVLGLVQDISGRHVLLVEDIIDTGVTLFEVLRGLKEMAPASIEVVSLLQKPDALKKELNIRYLGIKIPNKFVVGYGLDYNGYGRNLKEIFVLKEQA